MMFQSLRAPLARLVRGRRTFDGIARRGSVTAAIASIVLVSTLAAAAEPLADWQTWRSAEATASRLRQDLEYLADDRLQGRGPQTEGLQLAAEYIANTFESAELTTDLIDGGPFQPFEIELGGAAGPAENNRVTVAFASGESVVGELDEQMRPLSIGTTGSAEGPLVFAGYSITAPKLDYDDYRGIDAEGAIVMLIRKLPGTKSTGNNGGAPKFNDAEHRHHAFFASKIRQAVERGAKAVLIVNDRDSVAAAEDRVRRRIAAEKERIAKLQTSLAEAPDGLEKIRDRWQESIETSEKQLASLQRELTRAQRGLLEIDQAAGADGETTAVPVVSLSRDIADQILQAKTGKTLLETEQWFDADTTPHSFRADDIRVRVQTDLKESTATTANVIGTLPGQGHLADETIVIGAHYDHVGMGGYGSLAPGTVAVHNGADDNASGTTILMELARRLPRRFQQPDHRDLPRRRILFIAFSAEERGLLGSKHYVQQPLFPLSDTAAMINLDMVGRLRDNELTVYGTGTAAEFDALLDELNEPQPYNLYRVRSGYGPSDHQSFYENKIPVLFFFTGLHNDYHRPSDDSDKIDFGGMTRITDTVSQAAFRLATQPQRPTYQATEPGIEIRRQVTAYLGVSMREDPTDVVIEKVVSGSPADQAGLKPGDAIVSIGETPVRRILEVQEAVRARNPGDQVEVHVQRDGQSRTLSVTLGKRR